MTARRDGFAGPLAASWELCKSLPVKELFCGVAAHFAGVASLAATNDATGSGSDEGGGGANGTFVAQRRVDANGAVAVVVEIAVAGSVRAA